MTNLKKMEDDLQKKMEDDLNILFIFIDDWNNVFMFDCTTGNQKRVCPNQFSSGTIIAKQALVWTKLHKHGDTGSSLWRF